MKPQPPLGNYQFRISDHLADISSIPSIRRLSGAKHIQLKSSRNNDKMKLSKYSQNRDTSLL